MYMYERERLLLTSSSLLHVSAIHLKASEWLLVSILLISDNILSIHSHTSDTDTLVHLPSPFVTCGGCGLTGDTDRYCNEEGLGSERTGGGEREGGRERERERESQCV